MGATQLYFGMDINRDKRHTEINNDDYKLNGDHDITSVMREKGVKV